MSAKRSSERYEAGRPVIARLLSFEEWVNVGIISLFAMNGTVGFVPFGSQAVVTRLGVVLYWLCCILAFLSNRGRIHWELWTCRFAAIFLFWIVLSLSWGTSPLSTTYSPVLSSVCLFLYFNYILDRFTVSDFTRLLIWSLTILFVLSFLFILLVPAQGKETMGEGTALDIVGAWKGVFRQKNHLGLDSALAIAIFLGIKPKTDIDRFWRWGLLFLALILAYGSQSREAWVCIIIIVLFSFVLKFIKKLQPSSRSPLLLGTTVLLSMSAYLAYANLDGVLGIFGRDRTFTGRSGIWGASILLILKRPWLGYGTYGVWNTNEAFDAIVRIGFQATSAHNAYLDTILSYGLIGLILFLPIPISSFLFTFRAILSYTLDEFEIYIYMIIVILVISFAMSVMNYTPGITLILLLYAVANLEKVERSGLMSLRSNRARG